MTFGKKIALRMD